MATKKQKRLAAQARREEMLAEYRRSGLEAQKKDHARRERKLYQEWEEGHGKKHKKTFVEECPWCKDERRASQRQEMAVS